MNTKKFTQRFNLRAGALGMTQRAAAAKAGINPSMLSEYLSGKRSPPALRTLEKIAGALQCSAGWLAGEGPDTPGAAAHPAQLVPANTERLAIEQTDIFIPVLGEVHAGPFQLEDATHVRDYVAGDGADRGNFALKVRGDSMEPEYRDGDTIFCRPVTFELGPMMREEEEPHPRVPYEKAVKFDGKDCIVLFEGETSLKRIQVVKGRGLQYTIVMAPINPHYAKREVSRSHTFNIQAVVYKFTRQK